MATLFLARLAGEEHFEKLVAIKKIHDHLAHDEEFVQMFQDEARIAGLIHHPNVVTIFDHGSEQGSYYIAMEYVHGHNLAEVMRVAKRISGLLPWPHVVKIIADAAAGLNAAHELTTLDGKVLNVVHRDVSPQNLLVSYEGNVKVTDFGIAYAAEKIAHTTAGTVKGKLAYMSPEQASSGQVDRRSDIFSLGTVLFEGICLKRLFKAENDAATLYNVLDAKVPKPSSLRPDIPPKLDAVIRKALAKNPEERFSSAGEFEGALNEILAAEGAYVGHQQIAELMDTHFHEQREIRDAEIQRAIKEDMDRPVRSYAKPNETSKSAGPLETDMLLQETLKSKVPYAAVLGVGLVLFVFVVVGAFFFVRSRTPASGQPKDAAAVDATPVTGRRSIHPALDAGRRRPAKVTISVRVRPKVKGTVVIFRGKKTVTTHFVQDLPASTESEDVVVKAPGFQREVVPVTPARDMEVIVTLKPELRRLRFRGGNRTGGSRVGPSRQRGLRLKPPRF
ncbi:MAG: serine/threonine protein kinase [Deltaproteobacteria bacterium]|nr:serine/threonine protein kinase [Deltaproteobacteria bacterium]